MFDRIHIPVKDGSVALLAAGNADLPPLIFAHANGMCASIYSDLLLPLAGMFRIFAYDARGHGRTTLPADPATGASGLQYADDLIALVRALRRGGLIGAGARPFLAGHSLGGAASLRVAATAPDLVAAALLIDPALLAFGLEWSDDHGASVGQALAERTLRRRPHFPGREALADAYRGRGVFTGWPEAALQHYVADGARDVGDGIELACAPEWEAAGYHGTQPGFRNLMAAAGCPVRVLIAGESPLFSPPDRETMLRSFPEQTVVIPGVDHFLAVTAADTVRPWLAGIGSQGARAAR